MSNVSDTASEAFTAGYEDAFNGKVDLDNPYPEGSDNYLSWNDGFEYFFQEQENLMASKKEIEQPQDPILTEIEQSSLDSLAKRINVDLTNWPGNCYAIANKLIKAFKWDGAHPIYGHYLGPVADSCELFRPNSVTHHGWILTAQGVIVDPTRWVFEDVAPYIAVIHPDDKKLIGQYDEGGQQFVQQTRGPAPKDIVTKEELVVPPQNLLYLFEHLMSQSWNHPAKLKGLTRAQLFWIANLPYKIYGTDVKDVYGWLASQKLKVLIPIDFWTKAEREYGLTH